MSNQRILERIEQLNHQVALNVLPLVRHLSRRMIFLNALLWINLLLTAVIMAALIVWVVAYG